MSGRALLLSGGLDSGALAALIDPDLAVVVDYGQVCSVAEWRAARAIAEALNIPLTTIRADCSEVGSGELSGREESSHAPSPEWWPYRNQLLASLAAPIVLADGLDEIVFGTVHTDGFHADGTPEFIRQLDALMRMQEGGIGVSAPAINWSSAELIRRAGVGMELLGFAHSCHCGNLACGQCRGCQKHADVLDQIGLWP